MSIMPLVLEHQNKLGMLKKHAESNVMDMDELLDIYNGQAVPPGNRSEHTCVIPVGYKVVYSLEKQNIGTIRHLSISCGDKAGPPIVAVDMIMKILGFVGEIETYHVYEEEISDTHKAINIMEIVR